MNYAVVAASVALFLLGFRFLKVPEVAKAAIGETKGAAAVIRDSAMPEEEKETKIQRASLTLFGQLFSMIGRTAVCALVSFVPLVAAIWIGLTTEAAVVPLFYSWEVIVATIIAFIVVWRWR